MPLIGLTGGYATGKSVVAKMFKKLGAFIIDCDELAREVVEPGSSGLKKIVELFGPDVLRSDGVLDRTVLGNIIFHDDEKRKALESILHPPILRLVAQRSEIILSKNPKAIVIVVAPLLFESGLDKKCDSSITVACPLEQQIERAKMRDKISEEEINARINAQWSLDRKKDLSEFILDNSGDIDTTRRKVADLWRQISA